MKNHMHYLLQTCSSVSSRKKSFKFKLLWDILFKNFINLTLKFISKGTHSFTCAVKQIQLILIFLDITTSINFVGVMSSSVILYLQLEVWSVRNNCGLFFSFWSLLGETRYSWPFWELNNKNKSSIRLYLLRKIPSLHVKALF